jgi:hypothetical protein
MDSMSLLSLQVAVEETFGISFAPEDLEAQRRFDAIAALILQRLAPGSGGGSAAAPRAVITGHDRTASAGTAGSGEAKRPPRSPKGA